MRLQDMAIGRKDLYMMEPGILCEDPGWNVRLDGDNLTAHIRALADSIKEIGVQEPLTVYLKDGKPFVTNGHCRLEAVRIAMAEGADIKAVPVRVEERFSNEADRTLSMITRNSGLPLTPLEKAAVVKRLSGYGWSKADIAGKAGFSPSYVDYLLSLSALDPEISQRVIDGEISAATAVQTAQAVGQDAAKEKITEAVEKAKARGKTKATKKDFVNDAAFQLAKRLEVPLECVTEKKGEFTLLVRNLDESSIEDIVKAIRDTGYDIV